MSEIDSKLVAQARPYPNGWVYVIDGVFPDGAAVRPERIVGEWKVGPDGIITGEYKANGKYHAFKFKLFRMRLPVKPGKAMPSEMLLPRSPMARASQRGKRFAAAGHRKIVSVLGEQWGGQRWAPEFLAANGPQGTGYGERPWNLAWRQFGICTAQTGRAKISGP